jgi:hypothetical protein
MEPKIFTKKSPVTSCRMKGALMKDVRGQRRQEQAYLDRHMTRCLICGREFWKRKGQFCTTQCRLKAEGIDPDSQITTTHS